MLYDCEMCRHNLLKFIKIKKNYNNFGKVVNEVKKSNRDCIGDKPCGRIRCWGETMKYSGFSKEELKEIWYKDFKIKDDKELAES